MVGRDALVRLISIGAAVALAVAPLFFHQGNNMNDEEIRSSLAQITSGINQRNSARQVTPESVQNDDLTEALRELFASGTRCIRANYSGYGDSGSVESIEVGTAAAAMGHGTFTGLGGSSYWDAIADWIELNLPGGWEINEGSEGHAEIMLTGGDHLERADLSINHGSHETVTHWDTYGEERTFNAPS